MGAAATTTNKVSFEQYKDAAALYERLRKSNLCDGEMMHLIKGKLTEQSTGAVSKAKCDALNKQADVDESLPLKLTMKSPKAKGGNSTGSKSSVFFNTSEEEDYLANMSDDEDNEAMVADLRFMAEGGDFDSAFDLGVVYRIGSYGQKKDSEMVIKWWTIAGNGDIVDACYNLAVIYHHGDGVKRDLEKAIEWYQKAGELGHKEANGYVASLKAEIESSKRSAEREAAEVGEDETFDGTLDWYLKAAEGGDVNAMFKLGNIFAKGEYDQPVDFVQAGDWWCRAAGEGHTLALENITTHADDTLPPEEVYGTPGGRKDWTVIRTDLEEKLKIALPALQLMLGRLYQWVSCVLLCCFLWGASFSHFLHDRFVVLLISSSGEWR